MITVYTQPGCRPCKRVIKQLQTAGLPVDEVDISADLLARDYVQRFMQAKSLPVIEADGYEPIKGYQPELVKYLIETYPKEEANV